MGREGMDIIIVGGGIAGSSLALRLADMGFFPTLITRGGVGLEDPGTRRSMPFIRQGVAEKLSVPFNMELAAKRFEVTGMGVANGFLTHIFLRGLGQRDLRQNPWVTVDINKTEQRLHQKVLDNPDINVVSSNLTDVEIEDNKVTGVSTKEGVVPADLVVDATGKLAAVARLVEKKRPGEVVVSKSSQSGLIIGGTINFNREGLEDNFPDLDDTLYVGVLRDHPAIATLNPLTYDQDNSTHLLLVGGNTQAMKRAYTEARRKTGWGADISQARLITLDILTQNSVWNNLVKNITYIDRTIYSEYTDAVKLKIEDLRGLALVGDASQHLNPVSTLGVARAADDVVLLTGLLSGVSGREDLYSSITQFAQMQNDIAKRRLKRADFLYRAENFIISAYQKALR